jgi:hypothetical protein
MTDEQKARMPLITHPLVRASGHRPQALYAVSDARTVSSAAGRQSSCAPRRAAAHAAQPKYVISYPYRVGDVVIWDNASLLHSATLTDPDDRGRWPSRSGAIDQLDALESWRRRSRAERCNNSLPHGAKPRVANRPEDRIPLADSARFRGLAVFR